MLKENFVKQDNKYSEPSNKNRGNRVKICPNKALQVALYIHVGLPNFSQTSIKKRIQAYQKFVENNGWEIHDILVEKTENSENSNRMLSLALARLNSGSCDIIVADADFTSCRLARDSRKIFSEKMVIKS